MIAFLVIAREWLKDRATALFGWIGCYPREAAIIILCGLSLWFLHGRNEARDQLAQRIAAERDATGAQVSVNHEPARKSQAISEKSDAEAPAYYDSVRRAAADHAIRVRDPRPISRPNLPGADSSEQGVHGPVAAADLVCRPEVEDAQIVTASGRAAEMHQEAIDLIDAGVAVGTAGIGDR